MLRPHPGLGRTYGATPWSPKILEWASYSLVSQKKEKKENQSHTKRVCLGTLSIINDNVAELGRG